MRALLTGAAGAGLAVFVFIWRGVPGLLGASDALALSGLCFLIAALFLTAKHMHAYDLLIYSFYKFINIWKNRGFTSRESKDYHEFLAERQYGKTEVSYYITAGVLLLLALVMAFL